MEINHKDMVAKLAKPGKEIVSNMTAEEAHLIHMAVGIAGETLELLEAFLEDDRDKVLEELGDLEFYIEGLSQGAGMLLLTPEIIDPGVISEDPLPGLLVQSGKVLDTTKKLVFNKNAKKWDQLIIDMQNLRTALDTFYTLAEFTHQQALDHNIGKLGTRYKDFEYSDTAAQKRIDKA